ncbi:hypothetical protein SynROS8604_00805 [Synechococcus sp. ROS8604]|nr:hypothetical protein SynROS8604_00805 [Synechococcus sp. ROS8604]
MTSLAALSHAAHKGHKIVSDEVDKVTQNLDISDFQNSNKLCLIDEIRNEEDPIQSSLYG